MNTDTFLSERLAVIATIDPDVTAAGTVITDEIDMSKYRRVMFIVMAGTLGSSATLDFSVKGGASSNAGSHSTAITGKSITQLTQAGTDESDRQAIVEVSATEVRAQSLRYIEGSLVVATASSDAAVIVLGEPAHALPATEIDLASVAEIVT
ncbi:MAG: hypothetical protein KC547_20455 [Anaerolineae bacterium]|nr:hypothetical protein [Anaerolineae bacterium]